MTNNEFLSNKINLIYNLTIYNYEEVLTIGNLIKDEFEDEISKNEYRRNIFEIIVNYTNDFEDGIDNLLINVENIYNSLGFINVQPTLSILEIKYYIDKFGLELFNKTELNCIKLLNMEIPNFYFEIEKQIFFELLSNIGIQNKDPEKIKFILDKLNISTSNY